MSTPAHPWLLAQRALKRAFDVAFALTALVISAPVLAVAVIAIQFESPGPLLFRQERMGRGGRPFQLVKLRGMFVDAPERWPELYDYAGLRPDARDDFFFHETGDPRVTRVGRVLRRLSIDELPNFWNVLRGDMSVVGPRPEIPDVAHLYGDDLRRILSVRPGVTSPAKAKGRDALSLGETIAHDLEYIEKHSFLLDLGTIVRTAATVLRRGHVR